MPEPAKIFIGLKANPFVTDLYTTIFRLIDYSVKKGYHLDVWACGGATSLTSSLNGEYKPRNLVDLKIDYAEYPTTSAMVRSLIKKSNKKLNWHICRPCMEERGMTSQIEEVIIEPPHHFLKLLDNADHQMIVGIK